MLIFTFHYWLLMSSLCRTFSLWLSSSLQSCSWGSCTSNRRLFSLTLSDIGHRRSSMCSAPSQRAPSQTVVSLIYMGSRRTLPEPETWPRVLQSRKPLQYLVAETDKLSFSEPYKTSPVWKGRNERHWAYSFDVLIPSPSPTCLILY